VDQLRLAYLALALGLMGFGAIWGWLGARRSAEAQALPRRPRLAAVLFLLLAVGGTVVAVILEGRAARPW
jgi:formate hydrogenlyase subunit 4